MEDMRYCKICKTTIVTMAGGVLHDVACHPGTVDLRFVGSEQRAQLGNKRAYEDGLLGVSDDDALGIGFHD